MTFPLVAIRWEDITGESGWTALPEAQEYQPHICITVGFLISKTRRHYRVASTGTQGGVSSLDVIPKGAVLEVLELDGLFTAAGARRLAKFIGGAII